MLKVEALRVYKRSESCLVESIPSVPLVGHSVSEEYRFEDERRMSTERREIIRLPTFSITIMGMPDFTESVMNGLVIPKNFNRICKAYIQLNALLQRLVHEVIVENTRSLGSANRFLLKLTYVK